MDPGGSSTGARPLVSRSFLHSLICSRNRPQKKPNKEAARSKEKQKWEPWRPGPPLSRADAPGLVGTWTAQAAPASEMTQRDRAAWLPSVLLLFWVPGCLALRGPSTVAGTVGGSLSLQCHYDEHLKKDNKYWCRKPHFLCDKIVETKAPELERRHGRVSITDHPANLSFTVTMGNLTMEDAGQYQCGVNTPWFSGWDPVVLIKVTVSPAKKPWTPTSITSAKTSTTTPGIPAAMSTTLAMAGATPSASSREPFLQSQDTGLPVLLSLLALLLLLLAGASLLAWRMVKRRTEACENSKLSWNPTQVPEQREPCYADLELQTWPSQGKPAQPRGEEVEYSTVAAAQEDLHYSLLAFDPQSQGSTANRSPSQRPHEEPEYSVIKKT
ncbi:CMRF35-like molecule 8 [Tamandua tetradactyla]|uniref:CMRF35-like molecule 8 n=1 Tax=Tamandua tetradactyla TaxID=48850 RepID=UPI0040548464